MFKDLIKLANHLDSKGLTKEADYVDRLLKKADKFDDAFGDMEDAFADMKKPKLPKPNNKEEAVDYAKKADTELEDATDPFKKLNVFSKYHIERTDHNSQDDANACNIVFNGKEGKIILTVNISEYKNLCEVK